MSKRRGNPNWGKPEPLSGPVSLSDFEYLIKALRLSPEQYEDSAALRDWACKNMNHKYVPPDLLRAWGLTVKING